MDVKVSTSRSGVPAAVRIIGLRRRGIGTFCVVFVVAAAIAGAGAGGGARGVARPESVFFVTMVSMVDVDVCDVFNPPVPVVVLVGSMRDKIFCRHDLYRGGVPTITEDEDVSFWSSTILLPLLALLPALRVLLLVGAGTGAIASIAVAGFGGVAKASNMA